MSETPLLRILNDCAASSVHNATRDIDSKALTFSRLLEDQATVLTDSIYCSTRSRAERNDIELEVKCDSDDMVELAELDGRHNGGTWKHHQRSRAIGDGWQPGRSPLVTGGEGSPAHLQLWERFLLEGSEAA